MIFVNVFPALPTPSLSRDDVVAYLLQLKGDGLDIFQKGDKDNVFVIKLSEMDAIRISAHPDDGKCQVQLLYCENVRHLRDVSSMSQLQEIVARFGRTATGGEWPLRRSSGRLSENTPATNYLTIAQLIQSSKIEAVFDPFLENLSLATLIEIMSFGDGEVAQGVRLLGSINKTAGRVPRFTKAGVNAWLTQLGVTGEGRVMAQKEHRRFMLLSGGRSLLLGHSLNAIHKNEAIRVESDVEDRAFFDSEWAAATLLN